MQDFTPGDMANILKVVLKTEEHTPELTEESEESTDTTDMTDIIDTTEETIDNIDGTTEQTDGPDEIEETDVPDETDETDETEAETVNNSVRATVIDIRIAWENAPEKFWETQFPESVPMVDSLKRNLNSLVNFTSKDFGGEEFYIGTTDAKFFTPNYSGEMLSDARRYRTEVVDVTCNAEIKAIEKPRDSILQDIKQSIQSGIFFADILCIPFDIQSELVRNGYLMNLKKVPFLNLSKEYYNASATEAFTVNGNVFGLASDMTFDPSNVYAVFYNKSLVKGFNLTNPAEMYKNGGWNYDGMLSIAKEFTAATADLNNDSLWSIGIDRENDDILNGLFISSGNKYFTKREYNYPVLNFGNDKTRKLIETISNIFVQPVEDGENNAGMRNFMDSGESVQNEVFSNGNSLFSVLTLDLIPELANSEFDWGILPVPGLDGGANSVYSFANNDAMCISVLKGARNAEACGIIIETMSAASHRQLKDIYVSEQMRYNLRDVDSVTALNDIVNNITFNQYNAFPTIPEIRGSTVGILRDATNQKGEFADLYENSRNILNDFFKSSKIFERS